MTVPSASDLWTTFSDTVARVPGKEAFVQGDLTTTFGDWWHRSLDYGAAIQERGIGRGDRVVVWMDASAEMAAALYGVWAAGAIAVILSRAATAYQFSHAAQLTAPRLLLAPPGTSFPVEPPGSPVVYSSQVARASGRSLMVSPLPTEPALIIFTSGSTGRPKGVTHTHGSHSRGCAAVCAYQGLTAGDRILCPVPWSFDYGLKQGLYPTAALGALQVLPESGDRAGLVAAFERHRPTVVSGIPTLFGHLLHQLSAVDLSSVRLVTSSGGALAEPLRREILQRFAGAQLLLNYGSTESYRTTFLPPEQVQQHGASVGRSVPGVEVIVVLDDGTLAGADQIGEIVHRGDYLFLGYWNDPQATATALRPDPLAPPGCPDPPRVFFTGDLGRIDSSGLLHVVGRRDHQLKVMDVRVSPGEVEEVLLGSGLVREVAVFGRPHHSIGHAIWAVVVPVDGAGDDLERQLRRHARQTMTRFMAPKHYVVRAALPRTSSGKVDYRALAADPTGGEGELD